MTQPSIEQQAVFRAPEVVHATGMQGWVWKPVIDHLLDRAHCFALELREHGDSPLLPDADLSWTALGGDVLAAAQDVRGREIIGVGHSLGGAALLLAELEAPGTFRRLFLYEPAVRTETGGRGWGALVTARSRGSSPTPWRVTCWRNDSLQRKRRGGVPTFGMNDGAGDLAVLS